MTAPRPQLATAVPATDVRAAMRFALERLWSVLDLPRESPEGRALEAALLDPACAMLERAGKRFRGHLVELSWQLAGGGSACPPALPAIIEVIHAGTLIVDDIEDASPERRGAPTVHRLFGVPLALNAGNWLYFWALELLRGLELPADVELELHHRLVRMLVQGHAGQALDLAADVAQLPQARVEAHVAHMSRLKTGSFMGLAAAVGALAAGARPAVVEAVERFGLALGAGLQMLDDLGNLLGGRGQGAKRFEDLRHGRAHWPWAWLAGILEDGAWREAVARLEAVRAGRLQPAILAGELLERVGAPGRARVHALLDEAFADLRDAIGPHPLLASFRAEIERLESSYA